MADVKVNDQSSTQKSNQPAREASNQPQSGNPETLQRRQGGTGLARSRGTDPLGFGFSPYEFFSNPFGLMRRMTEEMDRNFGTLSGRTGSSSAGWIPAIEVSEREGNLNVHAELPGLRPEDVHVEITEDALIIQGERKSEHEHQIGGAYRSERRYGEFYREIGLPQGVKTDQAHAQFRNGVLEITVPIQQQASGRRQVPIQNGESQTGVAAGSGPSTASSRDTGETSTSQGRSGADRTSGTTNKAAAATTGSR